MQPQDVVIGKEYRKVPSAKSDLGWFDFGATVTVTGKYSSGTDPMYTATGPAKEDSVSGFAAGTIINGYIHLSQLEEIKPEAPAQPAELPVVHISLNGNSTTIVIQKRLTPDEMHAVLAEAGL